MGEPRYPSQQSGILTGRKSLMTDTRQCIYSGRYKLIIYSVYQHYSYQVVVLPLQQDICVRCHDYCNYTEHI